MGRAMPSVVSMCQPGAPGNHPPLVSWNRRPSPWRSNVTFATMVSAELHQRGLEEHAAIPQQRQQLGGVLVADIHRRVARVAALEPGQDAQRAAISGGGERLPLERDAREQRHTRIRVEHRHGEPALPDVDPELQMQRLEVALGREPCADPRRAGAGVRRRRRREARGNDGLLRLGAPAPFATTTGLAVASDLRLRVLLLLLLRWGLRLPARQLGARLVAHCDQERRDVLAVLAGLLERGARAVRRDALAAQADRDFVGLRIRALDAPLGARLVDAHVFDDLAFLVVESAQERPGAQEAAQTAVRQCGKSVS
jgi:hypothetical protein